MPRMYTTGAPLPCMTGSQTTARSAATGASSGRTTEMYTAMAAIGFFFQMNVDTISDSRVQERFQRVCCFMNCWKVSGTIVGLTAFCLWVTFQEPRAKLVGE